MEIETYVIPDSVTIVGDGAFEDCGRLTRVTIPDSVIIIEDNAFAFCRALTDVTIPDSVTEIGESAFNQSGLVSVTIPDSVTKVGDMAFYMCKSLVQAEFLGDAPKDFGTKVFTYVTDNFKIVYDENRQGWETPEWNGYPAFVRD